MNIKLSTQKIDIETALRSIRLHISKLKDMERVLVNGIKAIDNGEDMLNGSSVLAGEVREVMRGMSRGQIIP